MKHLPNLINCHSIGQLPVKSGTCKPLMYTSDLLIMTIEFNEQNHQNLSSTISSYNLMVIFAFKLLKSSRGNRFYYLSSLFSRSSYRSILWCKYIPKLCYIWYVFSIVILRLVRNCSQTISSVWRHHFLVVCTMSLYVKQDNWHISPRPYGTGSRPIENPFFLFYTGLNTVL